MKKNLILAAIVAFSIFSCNKTEKVEAPKPEAPKNTFKVALEMIVQQDDSVQVFYQDGNSTSFEEKNSLWMPVKGSASPQLVEFELPEDFVPAKLRFDISKKENQDPVVINNFIMKYLDKKYESKDSTMIYYFTAEQIQYDVAKKTLTPVVKKGQHYDPYIYSTDLLTKQVEKLRK